MDKVTTGKVIAMISALAPGADPAVIESAVQDWLDDHPEATTTVQDGSITLAKLASDVASEINKISSLSDEIAPYTADDYYKSLMELKGNTASVGNECSFTAWDARYSIIPMQYARHDIAMSTSGNLQIVLYTTNSQNVITADSGWKTSITIPAGTYFHVTMRRSNNANLTESDLDGLTITEDGFTLSDTAYLNDNPNVNIIAHKGFSAVAPENTIPAFKLAREKGFRFVETDVRFTYDGVPVLLHDATINRTARNADGTDISSTIAIADITYEDALEYDFGIWKGSEYSGTKIPTLQEFVVCCKRLGLHPYIEVRNDVAYTDEQYATMCGIVKNCGMKNNASWISHGRVKLEAILAIIPTARVGLLVDTLSQNLINIAVALQTDDNDVFLLTDYSTITSDNIQYAKSAGMPVEVWTVDTYAALLNLDPYCSGVETNGIMIGEIYKNNV